MKGGKVLEFVAVGADATFNVILFDAMNATFNVWFGFNAQVMKLLTTT